MSAEAHDPDESRSRMTLSGAVSLGIGAMVGAGIFALLGEAGAIAGSAVWLSFLIGGLLCLALGYAMAKMGAEYPLAGGTLSYILQGFGPGRVVGTAAWMGYLTSVVVVSSMVASSFGTYIAVILFGEPAPQGWAKFFGSALAVAAAFVCVVGPMLVDRAQSVIVLGLLAVFTVFIAVTLPMVDWSLLDAADYPPAADILSGSAVTFFAYLGFGVISFAARDLIDPRRNLPRAMYIALTMTTVLYVAIAVSVFGTLTVPQVVEYGPTAIAEAARPALGDAGFTAMALAAVLATASSVTATLYASQGLTSALAASGHFPALFGLRSRLGLHGGLIMTTLVTLLFINLFDVGVLAAIGSGVSLIVFMLVGTAAFRLRRRIGARPSILIVAIGGSATVLAVFVTDLYRNDRTALVAMLVLVVVSALVDAIRRPGRHARLGERT